MKGKKSYREAGGKVEEGTDVKDTSPKDVYAGKDSQVVKEAEEKKKGGRCAKKKGGKVDGEKAAHRLDRAPRKRGGRASGGRADKSPLSSAHSVSNRPGGEMEKEND